MTYNHQKWKHFTKYVKLYDFLAHPCDINNGGCDQICVRDGDNAQCACGDDYESSDDGETCGFYLLFPFPEGYSCYCQFLGFSWFPSSGYLRISPRQVIYT